ncbi:MAG: PD-(D/E)XK nuclease family protein [Candidatus Omnitrophota bacterium]
MRKLKNVLTWSFSRDRLFKECRRAYYYHYYASWGGWESGIDEGARKAYILKNARNIDAWIGDIVHQIIKWILESKFANSAGLFKDGREISHDEARAKAKGLLTRTWEQSRSQMWKENVKRNLNLIEHYYKREPSREDLALKLKKVTRSIRNFYESGLFKKFCGLKEENFLRLDELDSFDFEGTRVFAIPDFAVKSDKCTLYDWKTGKPSDKDILQLSCYTLYAMKKWQFEPDQIELVPACIAQEPAVFNLIEGIDINEVQEYVRGSISEMKAVLADVKENKINIDKCPKTKDTWRCSNCKFQEICILDT